jgi:AbrB family looped-hinge helix DNA binding protein
MEAIEVTRISSRGQVVIPQRIREKIGTKEGDAFMVAGHADTIILKRLQHPEELDALIEQTRSFAKAKKITPADVERAIKSARKRN